jgi:DNA-binding beta-propeller fold protein YncE
MHSFSNVLFATVLGISSHSFAAQAQRYLYVTNDAKATIDIFDIDNNHAKVRSFDISTGESGKRRIRGITGHAGTARIYISDSDGKFVAAYDITTDKMVWKKTYADCEFPDRLNVTNDGSVLFVPCKTSENHMVVDAETGEVITTIPMPKTPHNTFTGESGKHVYLSAKNSTTLFMADPTTYEKVGEIPGFSSGIRPFSVDREEKFAFMTMTKTLGFGVGDITSGKKLFEVSIQTPKERTQHKNAEAPRTHGGKPFSHGIAVRPNSKEVWFIDDAWGYLYVFDTSPLYQSTPEIPTHLASVPLFDDITKVWTDNRWRWVAFSTDGKYVYPASGYVVDAETKKKTDMKITPSEKLIEVDFEDGVPVAVSGQNGGFYEN